MHTSFFSTSQVASLLGIRKHKLEYALTSGYISEPAIRFLGKRVFSPSEVCNVAAYFGKDEGGEPCSVSSS